MHVGGCSPSWVCFLPSLSSRCEWRPPARCPVLSCPAELTPGTECAHLAPGPPPEGGKGGRWPGPGPRRRSSLPWGPVPGRRASACRAPGRALAAVPPGTLGSRPVQLRAGNRSSRLPQPPPATEQSMLGALGTPPPQETQTLSANRLRVRPLSPACRTPRTGNTVMAEGLLSGLHGDCAGIKWQLHRQLGNHFSHPRRVRPSCTRAGQTHAACIRDPTSRQERAKPKGRERKQGRREARREGGGTSSHTEAVRTVDRSPRRPT